jgi:hypothetical protein
MSNIGRVDQNVGIAVASRAMQEPLRQIDKLAGEEGSVVLNHDVKPGVRVDSDPRIPVYSDLLPMDSQAEPCP